MFRVVSAVALAIAGCLISAACAPTSKLAKSLPVGAACTEAAGEATMGSVAAARYHARRTLARSLGPARDYLATEGLRRVRVAAADVRCAPYALAPGRGGLTRCVATTRICSK